nr:hypothetical protein GCM10025730_00710 [Promicromonospora thailandica]
MVQAGEGELHLGLHAGDVGDPAPCGPRDQVVEERGLAGACLAAQHQHGAQATLDGRHDLVERRTVAGPAPQGLPGSPRGQSRHIVEPTLVCHICPGCPVEGMSEVVESQVRTSLTGFHRGGVSRYAGSRERLDPLVTDL